MRRAAAFTLALFTVACAEHDAGTLAPDLSIPVLFNHEDGGGGLGGHNFRTHATGAEEVPARETKAQGQAMFQLNADGSELSYKLIVANIQNVTQAHIHLAPVGVNGPVVLWLYPAGPPAQLIPGRSQGVLGEGVATDANLVGPLAGQTIADLVEHIRNGNAYVNVHTTQFPPGEVRGQIR